MSLQDVTLNLSDWTEHPDSSKALNFHPSQIYETMPRLLSCTSIRVLDLDDKNGNFDAPMSGTLRLVDLKDSLDFAALSYVWGPWTSSKDTISCNKCNTEITTNCHAALKSLRNSLGAVTIWVDSICINQSDNMENATQIPLMRDIYTYAHPT